MKSTPIFLHCLSTASHNSSAWAGVYKSPCVGSHVSPHGFPISGAFAHMALSVTPVHTSVYKDSARVWGHQWCHLFLYSFICSFHKLVLNTSYCQALIWVLRKLHQTSISSAIFPFFESDLLPQHLYCGCSCTCFGRCTVQGLRYGRQTLIQNWSVKEKGTC